jgi:U3 small nucleolar RNA-associated protein 12
MEKIYDQMDLREDLHTQDIGAGAEDAIMQENDTVGAPTKATSESLKAGDMLYECLTIWESDCDLYEKYTKQKQQNPQLSMPNRNALIVKLGGKDLEPDMVILKAVRTIRSSQLAQALLTLPFPYLSNLLIIIKSWVDIDPYMTSRILTHVLQNHFEEVVNSKKLRPVFLELEKLLTSRLTAEKDRIGFNASALMFLNRELKDKEIGFLDETEETNTKRKKAVTVVS